MYLQLHSIYSIHIILLEIHVRKIKNYGKSVEFSIQYLCTQRPESSFVISLPTLIKSPQDWQDDENFAFIKEPK